MQRLFVFGVLLVLVGCAYNPNYDGIHCGENRECPEGYTCIGPGESGRCLQPMPVDGEDGGVGDDGYDGGDTGDDHDYDYDHDHEYEHDNDGGDGGDDAGVCAQPDVDGDQHDSVECGGDDCDDGDSSVYPGAAEVCDGVDNDCDGDTDGMTRGCGFAHQGICAVGMETCTLGIWAGCPPAGDELCDPPGADENCNGSVDEGCECTPGQTRGCFFQVGVCQGAQEICVDFQWPGCDYFAHSQDYESPPEQSCDGLDNDCDDTTDGITRSCNIDHVGRCAVGTETCTDSAWAGCPQPEQEECDGIDNDCDDELDAIDGDLLLTACGLNAGVCAGNNVHDPSKCVDGQWQSCDHVEYGSDYGPEVCYDDLDNDCDSQTDCQHAACDGFERECWKQCFMGHQHCENGSWTACDARDPKAEEWGCNCCNNDIDDDCDGKTDWDDPDC